MGKAMREYSSRFRAAICLLFLLAATASPQTPVKQEPFKLFNASDAVYWTGGTLDIVSSLNKRELNPLFRDEAGIFSPSKNLAFKAGIWSAFKLLESRYRTPRQRRAISWVKVGAGIGYGALSIWNFKQPRARR